MMCPCLLPRRAWCQALVSAEGQRPKLFAPDVSVPKARRSCGSAAVTLGLLFTLAKGVPPPLLGWGFWFLGSSVPWRSRARITFPLQGRHLPERPEQRHLAGHDFF